MNNTLSYNKEEAWLVSGVAIIMMFFYHIINEPLMSPSAEIFKIPVGGTSVQQIFAKFGQLCVAVFAFNTGFVIYKYKENYCKYTHNLLRILNLLLAYWMVCIMFYVYGFIAGLTMPSQSVFVSNLLGLNLNTNGDFINVCYAWYVPFYIMLMFIAPVLSLFLSRTGWYTDIICYFALIFITNIFYYRHITFIWPLSASFTGFYVGKYRLIEKIRDFFKDKSIYLVILSVFPAMAIILGISNKFFDRVPLLYFQGILAFIFITIILLLNPYIPKLIRRIFLYLGNISMFLWFLQSIYAVAPDHLKRMLYLPYFPVLIVTMAILVLIPLAHLFQNLYTRLKQQIFTFDKLPIKKT